MRNLLLLALLLATASAQAADSAAVQRGRQLFIDYGCRKCHGTVGQGSEYGKRLLPDLLPVEAIVAFLRGTSFPMPGYSEALISDAQIGDIHAYLESLPKPKAPDQIPALRNLR